MGIKLKLCGMRRRQDIDYVNRYSPDYVGFILSDGFRRSVDLETFCELTGCLDKGIGRVGVFVKEPLENIRKYYADKLDVIQLHGDEDESYIERLRESIPAECEIWKAVRVRSAAHIERWNRSKADRLLLDAFQEGLVGGTGKTADWSLITAAKIEKPFFAAGGITAQNFTEAAITLNPYGIDLSGGIETDGAKDEAKIAEITELKNKFNREG